MIKNLLHTILGPGERLLRELAASNVLAAYEAEARRSRMLLAGLKMARNHVGDDVGATLDAVLEKCK